MTQIDPNLITAIELIADKISILTICFNVCVFALVITIYLHSQERR